MMVLVIGPARSGTSATAGVLHHLGVRMGDTFEAPNRHNPKGTFNDPSLTIEHLEMRSDLSSEKASRYAARVAKRNRDYPNWGIKDHALLPLLPRLLPVLQPTHVIVTSRDREESIASLLSFRDGRGGEKEATAYLAKNDADVAAFLEVWEGPTLHVEFLEFQEPAAVVDKVAEFVGVVVTADALAFPDPKLYRTRVHG